MSMNIFRSPNIRWPLVTLLIAAIVVLTAWAQFAPSGDPAIWTFEVVTSFPHDPDAFTQGLVVHDGRLYEGTGQYGESTLRRVDLATGRVEKMNALSSIYFGEGITILDDRLYQLTWQNNVVFVNDVDTLDRVATLRNEGEGWGLTHDGAHLIVSDGSATLRFHDPETFEIVKRLNVHADGQPVNSLNELEFINGEIWANLWYQDRIARISPESGAVLGWIDLSALYPQSRRASEDVLNGIAYDPDTDRLFVTGKNWPSLYEIEVGPP
jgi:glutamine cyclotransferase